MNTGQVSVTLVPWGGSSVPRYTEMYKREIRIQVSEILQQAEQLDKDGKPEDAKSRISAGISSLRLSGCYDEDLEEILTDLGVKVADFEAMGGDASRRKVRHRCRSNRLLYPWRSKQRKGAKSLFLLLKHASNNANSDCGKTRAIGNSEFSFFGMRICGCPVFCAMKWAKVAPDPCSSVLFIR